MAAYTIIPVPPTSTRYRRACGNNVALKLDAVFPLPTATLAKLIEDPQATIQLILLRLLTSTAIHTMEYNADIQPDEANVHILLFATKSGIQTIIEERAVLINAQHLIPFDQPGNRESPIGATLTPFTTMPGDSDLVVSREATMKYLSKKSIQQQSHVNPRPDHAKMIASIARADDEGNNQLVLDHIRRAQ